MQFFFLLSSLRNCGFLCTPVRYCLKDDEKQEPSKRNPAQNIAKGCIGCGARTHGHIRDENKRAAFVGGIQRDLAPVRIDDGRDIRRSCHHNGIVVLHGTEGDIGPGLLAKALELAEAVSE